MLERLPTDEPILLPERFIDPVDFNRVRFELRDDADFDADHIVFLAVDEVSDQGSLVSGDLSYAAVYCDRACDVHGPFEGKMVLEFSSDEFARTQMLARDDLLILIPAGTIVRTDVVQGGFFSMSSLG